MRTNRNQVVNAGICLLVTIVISLWETSASAGMLTLNFFNISSNKAADATIGEAQLSVIVTDEAIESISTLLDTDLLDEDPDGVRFIFLNTGSEDISITDVYFDDGSLLDISEVIYDPEVVSFSLGASPSNLPSAGSVDPVFEASDRFLAADSDPPAYPNGVNPGEFLVIDFSLQSLQTFADVVSELTDGRLRVGIHVQGFGSDGDGSESFVNLPVPAPSSMVLAGFGVLGMMGYGWRKRKTNLVN